MSTTKEYKEYVVNQLSFLGEITCRSMMGEYLLYFRGVLIGGIYDNRILLKRTEENKIFEMKEEIPYSGAKPMYLLEDMENLEKTQKIIEYTYESLKK